MGGALLAAVRPGAGIGGAEVAMRVRVPIAGNHDVELVALTVDRQAEAGHRVASGGGERQEGDGDAREAVRPAGHRAARESRERPS